MASASANWTQIRAFVATGVASGLTRDSASSARYDEYKRWICEHSIENAEYVLRYACWERSPCDATRRVALEPNLVPYCVAEDVRHWVLWTHPDDLSGDATLDATAAVDTAYAILGGAREGLDIVAFQNPPERRSIPTIAHAHVFIRCRSEAMRAVLEGNERLFRERSPFLRDQQRRERSATARRFVKYSALGNDFAIFEGSPALTPAAAAAVCRRGHGIGADGVCFARRPSSRSIGGADVRMELMNSDGTTPEMCGNGIRAFTKYVVERTALAVGASPLRVETPAGIRECYWSTEADGAVRTVRVDMGPVRWQSATVPASSASGIELVSRGKSFTAFGCDVGNPHLVVFLDGSNDANSVQAAAQKFGPDLEVCPLWPKHANVGFAAVHDGGARIRLAVWERGCGLTQACGTGATAAVAVAVRNGLCAAGHAIEVVQRGGGVLLITIEADFARAWMEGPVLEVYEGEMMLADDLGGGSLLGSKS